ncbi:PHP domain-containing protein [Methylocaldum marinum]|uniref:PHP domain-containing protein n=1 Tax=Methylocaldum marinum TaxID=1432792 RepID=UPI0011AEA8E3|nr:PHP domain-containing protein [Methylocaldum marinum]
MYDLHTHSTASDGAYSPSELVRRAAASGVTVLALTDHDSTAGLDEAETTALETDIRLIPGVEISVTWAEKTIHIVGLRIQRNCEILRRGLSGLQATRLERAQEIGRRLDRFGISGTFEAAREIAGDGMITRTHFARHLVELGLAGSLKDVFDRFLTRGKPGYVPTRWAEMAEAIAWIKTAGGVAALAHPQRYKLTGSWMRRLVGEFKECGGMAIEVVSGTASPGDTQSSADYARRFELHASIGSDFHSPETGWVKLGRLPPLPSDLPPVWTLWDR